MNNGIVIPVQALELGMVSSNNHPERQLLHKATLYCPNCTHESHVNGDWILHVHATYLDYECPECGKTIESRADNLAVVPPHRETLQLGDAN